MVIFLIPLVPLGEQYPSESSRLSSAFAQSRHVCVAAGMSKVLLVGLLFIYASLVSLHFKITFIIGS